jgi:hypothetical protein
MYEVQQGLDGIVNELKRTDEDLKVLARKARQE